VEGFVKQLGFKPRVKERGSYGWTKWRIKRGRSNGWNSFIVPVLYCIAL